MRKLTPLFLSGLLLVGATACGDDTDEETEYIEKAMAEYDPEEAEPLTEDDARCIVSAMVDGVGVDRLEELGITPEQFGSDDGSTFPEGLTEEEANGVVDGFEGCIDLPALFMESLAADGELTPEAQECLADAFNDDTIRKIFVTMLTQGEDALEDDPELMSEFMGIFQQCPEALSG